MSKQKLGFVESEEIVDTSTLEERKRDSKYDRKNIQEQLCAVGLVTRKVSIFERRQLLA